MIKSYLITDPAYYGTDTKTFSTKLSSILDSSKTDFALYRDKENKNYARFAEIFVSTCKSRKIAPILHQDYMLADTLNAYGVHLTSVQFDDIGPAKRLGLFVVVSTHTFDEIKKASELGADAVTYSPVFFSPGKGIPKGLARLKEIVGKINIKIIALGGITTDEQVRAVESCGVFAYASIRKFIKA
ncbi:thiamine phosphate synthase [Sulfurimonas sp. HSL-1716]|uniref:thiamine phosphate synthase n=1 Tax=Hydrocurvibacter sulfurireducens TaxID=3131937 RepID=UPI0031F78C65